MDKEILVPLDLSDAIAMIGRLQQQLAALEGDNEILRNMNKILKDSNVVLDEQIATLKGERDLWKFRAIAVAAHLDYETMSTDIKEWVDEYKKAHEALTAENKQLKEEEAAKYKAFWNNSRMVDQMKFEEYDWPRILKEGEER